MLYFYAYMPEIDPKFLKPYDPKETEERVYKQWQESGFFNPDNLPTTDYQLPTTNYSIMIAPPNITGSLHLGHALENTQSDILIRYHRMRGFKTLWLPGMDHAGIATQNAVEKQLKKEGLTRHDLGKEKFLQKIWEWKEQYGETIPNQLKKLGCSLDWSRLRFTMDEDYQEAVKEAFKHYYEKGLIYQGDRVINWCIKDQTALSDLEIEYNEEKAKLWFLKYPLADKSGFITVATTRPETMLGDSAVAVHPDDTRYKDLIGKKVLLPIVEREIPIVADDQVEKEFGTGVVKVTPAHSIFDSELAERHSLPFFKVINEVGKIIEVNEEFNGLKITAARELVIEKFKELDLVEKEEDLVHNVAKCYRCDSTIEPMLSKQWFLKMKPLAEKTIEAIKSGKVKYHPDRWEKVALDWLENIKDWCISRQIWWGHKVPVWFKTHTGTEYENIHFEEDKLYKKLNLKNKTEFNIFSNKFSLDHKIYKNNKIQRGSGDGKIQLHFEYVEFLKERGFLDSSWVEQNRTNRIRAKSEIFVGEKPPEAIGWTQSNDTFDTWFSSALWPFATLGWPRLAEASAKADQRNDLAEFYPTQVITSARDILHLWITRMIFSGLEFTGEVPFKDVIIHGTILNKDGKRMSKSLGTGIDPLDLIEKYGADALRFGLIFQALGGQDIRFAEDHVAMGKKFCNKLWNISRFVLEKTGGEISYKLPDGIEFPEEEEKILGLLEETRLKVEKAIQEYRFGDATHDIYDFVWKEFADKFIEYSKDKNTGENKVVLGFVLVSVLKMLHPFTPFITEEIWSTLPGANKLLMVESY